MKQRLFTLAFLILGKNQNWLILLFIKPSLFVYAVKRSSFPPLPSLSFLFSFPLFPSLFLHTPLFLPLSSLSIACIPIFLLQLLFLSFLPHIPHLHSLFLLFYSSFPSPFFHLHLHYRKGH